MKTPLFPLILLAMLAALVGCSSTPTSTSSRPGIYLPADSYQLAASHWSDVAKIRAEATRLSHQITQGQITKVQAAQMLNRFRINLIGRNTVDDDMYTIYLRSTVESQRGAISTTQSKRFVQDALRGWQQRWLNMQSRPANPAFTNFLMELMKMKPLS